MPAKYIYKNMVRSPPFHWLQAGDAVVPKHVVTGSVWMYFMDNLNQKQPQYMTAYNVYHITIYTGGLTHKDDKQFNPTTSRIESWDMMGVQPVREIE